MTRKEHITARIKLSVYNMLQRFKLQYNLTTTQIVEEAIFKFLSDMAENEEWLKKELEKAKRERKREENREKLKGLMLIVNQYKLLKKLERQGLKGKKLEEFKQALQEEAELWGYDNINLDEVINDGFKIRRNHKR